MTDNFMDSILPYFNSNVNNNVEKITEKVLPQKDIPTYLNDPTIQHLPVSLPENISYKPQLSDIAQVNYTFKAIVEREQRNKLDDSFRLEKTKEVESRTESSFKKTLASYNRYFSILSAVA